eukprot:CAMPEP_0171077348 /NCGR_PEP_ID=MMETSP0766_2-20121228/13979_1 /TAXON_ID=439317 /ORGANISM="Gambierdiscus australes, Strain CAWD 149" /LENGTH=172 /DNA_ID=CAMNT_0011534403 /DNA_START=133 /DNA_END=651 /DNA_ORIENTATION=-
MKEPMAPTAERFLALSLSPRVSGWSKTEPMVIHPSPATSLCLFWLFARASPTQPIPVPVKLGCMPSMTPKSVSLGSLPQMRPHRRMILPAIPRRTDAKPPLCETPQLRPPLSEDSPPLSPFSPPSASETSTSQASAARSSRPPARLSQNAASVYHTRPLASCLSQMSSTSSS